MFGFSLGWRWYLITGGFVALLSSYVFYLTMHDRILAERAKNVSLQAQVEGLQKESLQCKTAVHDANTSINTFRTLEQQRQKQAAIAVSLAESQAKIANARALLLSKRPPKSDDQCASAADLLQTYMKGRK